MNEIKSVMIDAVRYSVTKTDEPILVDNHLCRGDVDYNLARIRIAEKCDDNRGLQVLMHEVMHALLYERGFVEKCEDEELVDELSKGVINLIRANRDLINIIQAD